MSGDTPHSEEKAPLFSMPAPRVMPSQSCAQLGEVQKPLITIVRKINLTQARNVQIVPYFHVGLFFCLYFLRLGITN